MTDDTDFTYALSCRQPWAWLIVVGLKDIENRSRPIYKTGTLLIHAAIRFDLEGLNWVRLHFPRIVLPEEFTTGAIVGQAEIVDYVDRHDSRWFTGPCGILLRNAIEYKKSIPYKGQQGLFRVPNHVLQGAA